MTVGGDPVAVRSLHLGYGAAATTSYDQGVNFSQAVGAIGPSSFAGPAATSWRGYVGELQRANAAMSRAYDRVGSFLPRVAQAIEDTQKAEAAKIKAAAAVNTAEGALRQAETALSNAVTAATSPLSVGRPVLVAGPTPSEIFAVEVARGQVQVATQHLQEAQRLFRAAEHQFQEADDHRKRVLQQLATLCHTEADAIQAAMPPGAPPMFGGFSSLLYSEMHNAERNLLDIPTIAGSWLAPALLPQLRTDVSAFARSPQALAYFSSITSLYNLASKPLSTFRAYQVHQSGSSIWGWLGAGAVALVSGALVVVSDGTLSELVGPADSSLIGSLLSTSSTAIGISGLTGESLAAVDNVLHGQPIDPAGLILAGTSGWLGSAIPVALPTKLLGQALKYPAQLATRAVAGAASGAGLNAGAQYVLTGKVNGPTVLISAAAGGWGAGWPGPGDPDIGVSTAAKVALGIHSGFYPGIPGALVDPSAPPIQHR